MNRIWAIIERDLRRFRRSPTLMIVSMVMPLVQLVVLGYAFGGKVKNLQVGVVDQDHGVPAVKLKEMCQAVAANAQTFDTVVLRRPGGGAARFAQRENQRAAGDPAGVLAQGAGRGQPAHGAGGGQHGPVRGLGPGRDAEPTAGAVQRAPVPAAADGRRDAVRGGGLSVRALHPVSCCRGRSCWRSSFRP